MAMNTCHKSLKQMTDENLPTAYAIAMSTNSAKLNEDILQGYNMKDLEKVALAELPKNISKKDINRKISEKINDLKQLLKIKILVLLMTLHIKLNFKIHYIELYL